jgi:signal transduction histidine kinase
MSILLLVEDNPGDARLIGEMLKETEHSFTQFHMARSLKEARELPVDHGSVATVLLDLGLPDSDGIDTLLAIRGTYPDSAIVVLTGFDNEEMTLRALSEGAQSYLLKNELSASILGNTLRYSLERHRFILRLRDQEHRNAELRVSEEMARSALDNQQQLNAMRSKFVSLVSHEFRTPLAIIQTSADLIDRHANNLDPAKVHSYSLRIQTKVRELTALLNNLLDLEKMERQDLLCTPTEFDLVQLGEDQLSEMRALAKEGQRLVHVHGAEDGTVCLDRSMVNNILTNLLSNAIKYSPPGATITLHTGLNNGQASLSVEDEGVGIPQEEQEMLFDRFFRGSNVDSSQGTGLGLPIVKQYLELMGGTISFTSVPGRTVFHVVLPRRMAE